MSSEQRPQNATARFAEFIESFPYESLPRDVLERAKELLYDTLGAALSATSPGYDIAPVLNAYVEKVGAGSGVQVIGSRLQTDVVNAALVNGTLAYFCDIEPHHPRAVHHATAVVAPAALAVGEAENASGKDVLAAFIIGVDVACRVSSALDPTLLYARGFHPSSVAGTFGAMAAAARLLGLRGQALLHAFGLAGTQTSGMLAWVSDETEHSRPFNIGLAAANGVRAAKLASLGFGGPPAIFEGKYPLGHAFTGHWDERELFHGLGTGFKVMEFWFKRYSCCAFIHPAMDGLMQIVGPRDLKGDDIQQIRLRYPRSGYKVIDGNPLRSHNAQYVLALASYKRNVVLRDILHDVRQDDEAIRSLSERVEVVGDEELDKTYPDKYRSIVEVVTKDGETLVADIHYPKGAPENPLTRDEIREKFLFLTDRVVSRQRAGEIEARVMALEDLDSIRDLTRLLGAE